MFTGIVEELGTIAEVTDQGDAIRLTVEAATVLEGTGLGDSISVNGCCLTVSELGDGRWTADVMQETLDKTSLRGAAPGDRVNLERAVTVDKRLGGHIVQGHVDGVGEIVSRSPSEHWDVVEISLPAHLSRYLVDKGSITVDGVSLTVVEARETSFTVSLIPETLARTTLGSRRVGDLVNLEADVIAKHVEKLLGGYLHPDAHPRARPPERGPLMNDLLEWLVHGTIPVPGGELGAREVIGNLFGLASAILGMKRFVWAWPVGLVGNVLLFTVFATGELSGQIDEPAVGPGRSPGLLRDRLGLRLVALVAGPARAVAPRTAARSRRAGRRTPSGCSCSSSASSATQRRTSC